MPEQRVTLPDHTVVKIPDGARSVVAVCKGVEINVWVFFTSELAQRFADNRNKFSSVFQQPWKYEVR